MTKDGYCRVLLDIKDTKIMKLESEITKFRIEYEKQIVKLQKENAELKAQIEKMKQDLDSARENANRQEQWEIYSVLNDIYNDNFEVITSVSN